MKVVSAASSSRISTTVTSPALLGQEHAGLHANLAAADDDHVVADPIGVHDGLGGHGDICAVGAGNLGHHRFSAQGGDDHVILPLDHVRGDPGIHHHPDVPLGHLGDQEVLVILQRPFEGDVVGVLDGAPQLVGGLKESDLVSPVGQIHGRAHAAGAAADHGNGLDPRGGVEVPIHRLKAKLGIDGADGGHDVVPAPAVALVAAQAGGRCPRSGPSWTSSP